MSNTKACTHSSARPQNRDTVQPQLIKHPAKLYNYNLHEFSFEILTNHHFRLNRRRDSQCQWNSAVPHSLSAFGAKAKLWDQKKIIIFLLVWYRHWSCGLGHRSSPLAPLFCFRGIRIYLSPLSLLPDGNNCSLFTQINLEEEGERGERGGVRNLA